MREFQLVIQNRTGLHARPAKVLVKATKKFESDIRIFHGDKQANAKSMISVLTLGVECGGEVRFEVVGADEDAAAQALRSLIEQGLDEELPSTSVPVSASSPKSEVVLPVIQDQNVGKQLTGVPAAPGIAIGPVFQWQRNQIIVDETFTDVVTERASLDKAFQAAKEQLVALHNKLVTQSAASEAAIFEVHLEVLEDPELLERVYEGIESQHSAAHAWQVAIDDRANILAALSDSLLAARAADLRDVGDRVLRLLLGDKDGDSNVLPAYPVIVVASNLTPSDTAALDSDKVLGFCTAAGGPTAHSAIIARARGLPAVVSAGEAVLRLKNETLVILDGDAGTLIIDPDAEVLKAAQIAQSQYRACWDAAQKLSSEPAITQDGHRVEVVANIGGVDDAQQAYARGAEGVGLLRTEFLFLDRDTPPTEEEQFEVYRDIALALKGQPVIIRTLDIGGDKPLPYVAVPEEMNPFLGERGIRLCLARPHLLRQQLRAILRASEHGKLRIMFPMVSDISEVRQARAMVEELQSQLGAGSVEIGIMVEVPSAALLSDIFAPEVDFFSIGTNDLTQYTLAIDRTHATLANKLDGLHPAVLRLIARTVESAHQAGKWVGVCGELGSDPQAIPVLVGLGVDELSVSTPAIPMVKAQVRELQLESLRVLVSEVLACSTASEVRDKVKTMR
ncbi:MAG: phosphoenolpyruvate--protein phosphotransferase [Anaerolineae bacterium]|nr:phosphoenolpyruvate--protein phosphotransferase [Anaerolineae bacterium]